jgi:formylglycine-generating enzyme required for sulfatase activity
MTRRACGGLGAAALLLGGLLDAAPAPPGSAKQFTNSIGMKFVLIPKGKFLMGSPADEPERRSVEQQHEVEISRPFYLGAHEVTQEQFEKVLGRNPSAFAATGARRALVAGLDTRRFPVDSVSWEDATAFCAKLSALPRE